MPVGPVLPNPWDAAWLSTASTTLEALEWMSGIPRDALEAEIRQVIRAVLADELGPGDVRVRIIDDAFEADIALLVTEAADGDPAHLPVDAARLLRPDAGPHELVWLPVDLERFGAPTWERLHEAIERILLGARPPLDPADVETEIDTRRPAFAP